MCCPLKMKESVTFVFLATLLAVVPNGKNTLLSSPKDLDNLDEYQNTHEVLHDKMFNPPFPKHCQHVLDRGFKENGLYLIKPDASPDPFLVYCDLNTIGGGWTYFLNRFDGSQKFSRKYIDYEQGFGNLDGEFWLGLEKLHYLIDVYPNELLIELEDWDSTKVFAHYGLFNIGNASEGYYIKLLGQHSGDAGDSLSFHAGMKFSAPGNDVSTGKCVSTFGCGWWFDGCHRSLLTGVYFGNVTLASNNAWAGVMWEKFRGPDRSLQKAKMLVRFKTFVNRFITN